VSVARAACLKKRSQQGVTKSQGAAHEYDRNDAGLEAKERDECSRADDGRYPVKVAGNSARPQHVVSKKHREVEDDANDCRCDAGERRRELDIAVRSFNQWCAQKDKNKAREERKVRDDERACGAGEEEAVSAEDLFSPRADKADERDDHDQRTGCGLAERKAIDHLRGRQPLILFDAALVYVRQHSVSAAKSKQRCLCEEPTHLCQCGVPAVIPGECCHCACP